MKRPRSSYDTVLVFGPDCDKGISNSQIWILPETENGHYFVRRAMEVKIISVIEVSVASRRVSNIFCRLMNWVVIP